MTLHRLQLRPRSPWRTPWQADTLTGMLLVTCARTHGPEGLRHRLIDPMLAGSPPFVLSDACPGDLLPMPLWLRLHPPSDPAQPSAVDRKSLKNKRWLTPSAFEQAQQGKPPPLDSLVADDDLFLHHASQHNTLSRLTDTTGLSDSGLAPFARAQTMLQARQVNDPSKPGSSLPQQPCLSVYFRILDPDTQAAADLLLDLFHELSLTGFGADTSTGRGQFDILGDPQPMPQLDNPTTNASAPSNALVSLSTFQPGPLDPTDGLWESFPKFAKLAPELANVAGDHRKNTLILFKPGACFRADPAQHRFLGRAIPMNQLLPAHAAQALSQQSINLIHPAFALTVPIYMENTA